MVTDLVTKSLRHVLQTLHSLNVPHALMGGVALAAWKHVRMTRDVDLLTDIEPNELDGVLRALREAGMIAKRQPPLIVMERQRLVSLTYEPPDSFIDVQIDLFLAESDFQRAALARRATTVLPISDLEVAVLSCEDLIVFKLLAGRIIDRADAAALLRLNQGTIDVHYLRQQCHALNLAVELDEVVREASPSASDFTSE